jgi:hypothetical protein
MSVLRNRTSSCGERFDEPLRHAGDLEVTVLVAGAGVAQRRITS